METFVGDIVTISLETNITLTGYTLYIKYIKPSGVTGFWSATIDPADASKMTYETNSTDLNEDGEWKLQAFAVSGGTFRGHGRVIALLVKEMLGTITTAAPTTAAP